MREAKGRDRGKLLSLQLRPVGRRDTPTWEEGGGRGEVGRGGGRGEAQEGSRDPSRETSAAPAPRWFPTRYRFLGGAATWAAAVRSLSSPLRGLGGFRPIDASPPRKGATPASPGPSSPDLRGVTLKVFPRLSTPPDFSLPCSNPPLFPAGNGAPSSYSSARQSGLWSPLVP